MKINKKKSKEFVIHKKFYQFLLNPYLIIMFFLIVLPFLLTCFYSLISPSGNNISFVINLQNFIYFFSNQVFIKSLVLSIAYALLAAAICVVIGYPFAYFLAFTKSKLLKNNIFLLISMPLWISILLRSIGLQNFFDVIDPTLLGTWFSVVIGMVYLFLPFMILPIYNSLERIELVLIDASNDLGATPFKTFWKIIFKFSIPGLFSGIILVVIQASTSLVIVKYMGAGKIELISKVIESYFFQGSNFAFGATISVILIFFIALILGITKLIQRKIVGKVEYNEEVY